MAFLRVLSICVVAFLVLPIPLVASQRRNSTILPDSSLTASSPNNSYWLSASGIYAFGFFPRGVHGYSVGVFMAGIPQRTVLWVARRDDPPVPGNSTVRFTIDGRLLLRTSNEDTVIADPDEVTVSASMLDSGDFVLYNSQQNVTWQSFDNPTDTILEEQSLSNGKEMLSAASNDDLSSGTLRIKMQTDGNLVMYPVGTPDTRSYAYWSSRSFGTGDTVTLNLAGDGFLYLMNGTGTYLRNLTSRGYTYPNIVYRARIDPDGIFRLYSYNLTEMGNWSMVWSTTTDSCQPMGLCGLNAYCTNIDQVAKCVCIPGFDFVQTGNETSGCQRSFTAESCNALGSNAGYTMEVVSNTVWENESYWASTVRSESECREQCMQDCNCEAVIYSSSSCSKQRLPLRFGRRDLDSSDAVYVKVGQMTPGARNDTRTPLQEPGRDRIRKDVLIVSLILIALALATIVSSGILLYRKSVWSYKAITKEGSGRMIEDVAPISFTFAELMKLTRDFSEVIGKGAYGIVYRGTMSSGKVVAVKKLERVSTEAEKEFYTEVKIIARTQHRNLVRLVGYCLDGSNRLLVYEYMRNGSLAGLLFAPEKLLSWDEKMGIIRNIARGLLYLHDECDTQIIHCDVKPENILIDEHRCAKISDFGLSKLLKPDQTNTYTNIRGTRGYVAPEWHKKLPVTTKADVFSFGVLLLETICSRRNMDQGLPEEEIILENWVYDCFQAGELHRLVNEDEGVDRKQLNRMVKVALWCILEEPSLRPPMRKVLLMLEGTVDIPSPPCPTSFISCI